MSTTELNIPENQQETPGTPRTPKTPGTPARQHPQQQQQPQQEEVQGGGGGGNQQNTLSEQNYLQLENDLKGLGKLINDIKKENPYSASATNLQNRMNDLLEK